MHDLATEIMIVTILDKKLRKSRKIFLDVGGFEGESSRAALDPRFGFDAVFTFEPVQSCANNIENTVRDRRLTVLRFGLYDQTASLPLGDAGELGGSVYTQDNNGQLCPFVKASDWFADNIAENDQVWLKLNCEGAELNILNDLLDSGEASKVREALIDLDAAKFPSLHASAEALLIRLKSAPFSFHYPPEVQYGAVTNYGGIRQWLVMTGAATKSRFASAIYNLPLAMDRRFNGYHKIRLLRLLRLRPEPRLISPSQRATWSPIYEQRGPLNFD